MKRDMDLIRLILLEIEKSDEEEIENIIIPKYDSEIVKFHCELLFQNKMVKSFYTDVIDNYYIGQLTWEGNDYLDKIRDNSVWNKTKEVIAKKGLPFVFDTIKTVAVGVISAAAEGAITSLI